MNATLTRRETEAILYLTAYETIKIAADKRCVSEHTQKNQVRVAMDKLGVYTQVGLMKEFFHILYGVRFNLGDARQLIASCMLLLFISAMSHVDMFTRRVRARRTDVMIEVNE
jgi:ABC-type taurine transport system ATPase subunit